MVDTVIHDPDGAAARVVGGQLQTKSIVETQLQNISDTLGQSYSWTSTYSATAGEEVFTVRNDSTTQKRLNIDQVWIGADAAAVFSWGKMISGTPAGTEVVGQPLNVDLSRVADATAFGNASVTGTVVIGDNAWLQVPADATQMFDLEGAWILGKDDVFGIRTNTTATVYVTVIAHFDDVV